MAHIRIHQITGICQIILKIQDPHLRRTWDTPCIRGMVNLHRVSTLSWGTAWSNAWLVMDILVLVDLAVHFQQQFFKEPIQNATTKIHRLNKNESFCRIYVCIIGT